MKTLDPISIPLNRASLIEASAGTGKTYTMANLYLRLVLGVECEPLMVEQILVVTFTKAATQELRDRIRAKLRNVAKWFADPDSDDARKNLADPFLARLYQQIQPNLAEALLRLQIAEREMDLASIYTIDSFCQKMLFQYAFDSGVRFDINLQTDERELLQRLSEETWRELFYPASLEETELVARLLQSPENALNKVKGYLSGILPPLTESQQRELNEDYAQQAGRFEQFLATARAYWQTNEADIIAPIQTAFEQQNADKKIKILNGVSYKEESFKNKWLPTIRAWATNRDWSFPSKELSYFSQSMLNAKASKGAEILRSSHFVQWDEFIQQFETFSDISNQIETKLLYRFFQHLRQKLTDYKHTHLEKNFSDMLTYFYEALQGEKGDVLAGKIRQQFGFAMIDESQDTDNIQYQIFKRIFLDGDKPYGFIMIGDPKQSIYKFRGADIFAYLDAAKQVDAKFTLAKNWRSLPAIVETVNKLFTLPDNKPAFLYPEITFSAVDFKQSDEKLLGNQQETNLYLLTKGYNTTQAAEHCAEQIVLQLNAAQKGEKWVLSEQNETLVERELTPKDIAILVRSHDEAAEIKRSLAARNLQSVYLSERNSVYQSQDAADLAVILNACLHPFSSRALLAALGTSLWGLTAADLFQIKNNEIEWDSYVEHFAHYFQVWQLQGVLPMLHKLFIQQQIIARLNSHDDADRRITNILHLAELLQEKMDSVENESSLLRWFHEQIANPNGDSDEQVLRLESEADLIKIITIHKSKGLEYPVVWLPFIAKNAQGARAASMAIYRDEENQVRWSFNSGDEQIKQYRDQAEHAEDLRLLYVALTRAKYQLHLVLPEVWGDKWNAIHYLLAQGDIQKALNTRDAFERKGIAYQAVSLAETFATSRFEPTSTEMNDVEAKTFQGKIRERGSVTSFTALQAQHERLQHVLRNQPLVGWQDMALDYDSHVIATTSIELEQQGERNPFQFPHSTNVGNVLHRFFERQDFQQPITHDSIHALCEQLNLDENWIEPVLQWFERVLVTPIGDKPFRLSQISQATRLTEWQFYLRLGNRKALPQLNALLKQHSRLAKQLPDLQLLQVEGFVRGFVDCIVQVENQFYVIDYKSNFLGYLPQDYAREKIEKTMGQYRYDLQYLLYTLAVHRYLRSRLGQNYDYQRDFGGIAYLFLRGMDGSHNSGVYFDKPSGVLIDAMDELFG